MSTRTQQRRRAARERLLQSLYAQAVAGESTELGNLRGAFSDQERDEVEDRTYAAEVAQVLQARAEEIDACISAASSNWRIERMDAVDISILRLATAEFLAGAAPAPVVINEAVELAKRFGSETSSAFVNGVLDAVLRGRRAK